MKDFSQRFTFTDIRKSAILADKMSTFIGT